MMVVLGMFAALLIGAALGLFGGGGSILTVPTLHYIFGIEAHAAIAGSLVIVGGTSLVTLIPHLRANRVRLDVGIPFGAASMVGAFVAGRISHRIPAGILLAGFALIMVLAGAAMLRPRPAARSGGSKIRLILQGLAVGAVSGLVGAGGGFLIVPALVVLVGLPMIEAVATSLLVITLSSAVAFAATISSVTLDVPVVGGVLALALIGGAIGSRLASRVSPVHLRRGFGALVLVMAAVILSAELPGLFGA